MSEGVGQDADVEVNQVIQVSYICINKLIHLGDVAFLDPSTVGGGCPPVVGRIVGLGVVGGVVGGGVIVRGVGLDLAGLGCRVGVVGSNESWVHIGFAG